MIKSASVSPVGEAANAPSTVVPIYGPDATIQGRVSYRQRYWEGDMYLELWWQGVPVLVPCRRVTDVRAPDRVYVLADGTIWIAEGQHSAPSPVIAELACAHRGPPSR